MKLTEKQIEILNKYNIDYKSYEELNDLLDAINDEMISHVDEHDEPLKEFLELERIYDEIYDKNI